MMRAAHVVRGRVLLLGSVERQGGRTAGVRVRWLSCSSPQPQHVPAEELRASGGGNWTRRVT